MPTAAELTGNFSALAAQGIALYSPVTGCGYGQSGTAPNCSGAITDIIPTAMDTLSSAVNKQYLAAQEPLSVAATGANAGLYNTLTTSTNNNIDNTQYLARLDYAIGQNDHISGRYFYNQDNFQRPFTAPLGFYAANLFRNQSLTLSEAHVFSPTLTGAVYFGFYRGARTQIPEAPGLKTDFQLGQTGVPYGKLTENLVPFPGVRDNLTNINIFSGGALTQDSTTFDLRPDRQAGAQAHADHGRRHGKVAHRHGRLLLHAGRQYLQWCAHAGAWRHDVAVWIHEERQRIR